MRPTAFMEFSLFRENPDRRSLFCGEVGPGALTQGPVGVSLPTRQVRRREIESAAILQLLAALEFPQPARAELPGDCFSGLTLSPLVARPRAQPSTPG